MSTHDDMAADMRSQINTMNMLGPDLYFEVFTGSTYTEREKHRRFIDGLVATIMCRPQSSKSS